MKRWSLMVLLSGVVMSVGCAVDEGGAPSEAVAREIEAADLEDSLPHAPPSQQQSEPVEITDVSMASGGTCLQCWQNSQYFCGGFPSFSCPIGWYNYFPPSGNCGWCYQDVCTNVPVTGGISANPTVVNIYTGSGTGCSSIQWNAACGTAQVYVSSNGGSETLFAQGRTGTQSACWIQPGVSYDFCLYEGTSHSNKLGCVRVEGRDAGTPPNPCDSCPSGSSCRCGDDVCIPNNMYCP